MRFIVQGEDALTPVLRAIPKAYAKCAADIEKANKKLYNQTTLLSTTTARTITAAFTSLPKKAKQYVDQVNKVFKGMKPISVPVTLAVDSSGVEAAVKAMQEAVAAISAAQSQAPTPSGQTVQTVQQSNAAAPDYSGMADKVKPIRYVSASGRYNRDQSQHIESLVGGVTRATERAEKYAKIVQSGLDPSAAGLYRKAILDVVEAQRKLRTSALGLSTASKAALIPAYERATEAVKDFNDQLGKGQKNIKGTKGLFEGMAGAVRYLAMNKAFGVITRLSGKDGFDAVIDAVNKANETLHVGRDELRLYKRDINDLARSGSVSLHQLGDSFDSLVKAGVRGREALTRGTRLVSEINQATGRNTADTARQYYADTTKYGLSASQIEAITATQSKLASRTGANFDDIAKNAESYRASMSAFFMSMPQDQKIRGINQSSVLASVLTSHLGPNAQDVIRLIGGAANNDPESRRQLAAMGIGNDSVEQLRRGDLRGVMGGIGGFARQINQISPENRRQSVLARGLNFSDDQIQGLLTMNNALKEFDELTEKTKTDAKDAGVYLKKLGDDNLTWAKKFKNTIGGIAVGMGLGDLYDGFKELNPQMLAATVYLAKLSAQAVVWTGGKAAGLAKGLTSLFRAKKEIGVVTDIVSAAGGAAEAAGAVGAAGSVGGLAGIGAGITALMTGIGAGIAGFGAAIMTPAGAVGMTVIAGVGAALFYEIQKTISTVADGIGKVVKSVDGVNADKGKLEKLKLVGETMHAITNVVTDLAKTAKSSYGMTWKFSTVLGKSQLGELWRWMDNTVGTINDLTAKMGTLSVSDGTLKNITRIGDFMRATASVYTSLETTATANRNLSKGWWDSITKRSGLLHGLKKMMPSIAGIVETINKTFATISDTGQTIRKITQAAAMVGAMAPMYTSLSQVAQSSRELDWTVSDVLVLRFRSRLSTMTNLMPWVHDAVVESVNQFSSIPDPTSAGLGIERASQVVTKLAGFYGTMVDLGSKAGNLSNRFAETSQLQYITDYMPGVRKAIDEMAVEFGTNLTADTDKGIAGANRATALINAVIPVYKSFDELSKYATSAMENVDAINGADGKAVDLVGKLSKSFLFSPETSKAIKLHVEASDEEKQSLVKLQEIAASLAQIVTAMQNGTPMPPGAKIPAIPFTRKNPEANMSPVM